MSNDSQEDGKCNAHPTQDGGYCANVAGQGTDHLGEGKCKYHGGCSTGAPKGNQNAVKHGLYAKRSNYYENLPAEEKAWIDALVKSMLEDAPFDKDTFHKFSQLRNIAIDMHKLRNSQDYTGEEGLIVENVERDDKGDPIFRDGELVTRKEENPINLTYDRLNRSMRATLKDLGVWTDDPEGRKADAGASVSEQLSALRSELNEEDD